MQKQINILENFCETWGTKVNLAKTKVMVFRNGGIVKSNEIFFFQGEKLETVSYYKYLGIIFTATLCWSKAIHMLPIQAQKALAI